MFGKWLKELAAETFASVMFIIGLVSNVLTFFPGLPAPLLRVLGVSLLGLGFVWANFGVYKKLHGRISRLEGDRQTQINSPRDLSISLSVQGEADQSLKVDAEEMVTALSLEYLTTDGTCIARDDVRKSGKSLVIALEEDSGRAIWNFPRNDRSMFDSSGPIKLRLTLSANGKARICILPATILTKMRGSAVWPVIRGSETFHLN